MTEPRYRAIPHIDTLFVDDQYLFLYPERIFQVSELAGTLLLGCREPVTLRQVCDLLVQTFGDPGDVEERTRELLEDLIDRRLLQHHVERNSLDAEPEPTMEPPPDE